MKTLLSRTEDMEHRASRVLLVDDDEFVAISLRHYLMSRGCAVETAGDRATAEALLRERKYDLVLADPFMTGETGREGASFLATLRDLQPAAVLVVVSAYTSPQLVAAGRAANAIAVLTKPQPVVFLSQLVMSALKEEIER